MKSAIASPLLLLAVSATVMFLNLGTPRLWDRDEPRNAGCAVEMKERGDLVVPMFNDQLRQQKPVLLYWLIQSAETVFGRNEFSARFWSALLAVGSVMATWGIARRLFSEQAALFSGLVLASSVMFVVAGRAATPDSVLIFCSTMAMYFYVAGVFPLSSARNTPPLSGNRPTWFPRSLPCILAMYGMMGIGVLAKGPVAFVLPSAIIGMFMLIVRLPAQAAGSAVTGWLGQFVLAIARPFHPRHFLMTFLAMKPWWLVAAVLLIAGPWYWMVGVRTEGDWLELFFLRENFQRATNVFESHRGGWWYYPVAIIAGFFPASVFLLPVMVKADQDISSRQPNRAALVFLICWVGVQVCLFSLAKTKLPSYVTPCYPALAILTGWFLSQIKTGNATSITELFRKLSATSLLLSGLAITVALVVLGERWLDGNRMMALIGLIPVTGAAVLFWMPTQHGRHFSGVVYLGTAVAFTVATFGIGAVVIDRHRTDIAFFEGLREDPSPVFATWGCLESSWVYYSGKSIYQLTEADQPWPWRESREQFWTPRDWPSPGQFAEAFPDAPLVTTSHRKDELLARLPDYEAVESCEWFLHDEELVLVRRKEPAGERSTSLPRKVERTTR
jgi:4-amino-4-deoxy-L-arabinose transferase-like glycosyltransferase